MKNLLAIFVVGLSSLAFTFERPRVIYGEDNRAEVYEITDSALLNVSKSTVAMFKNTALVNGDQGAIEVKSTKFGDSYRLCKEEPFFDQPNPALCSGFLVGEDLIATAGHCVKSQADCDEVSFVFDYKMKDATTAPAILEKDQVYKCAKIIKQNFTNQDDYALVKLDRPVVNRVPLKLSKQSPLVNDAMIVIGHPAGIPTKVAGGANVRSNENGYFMANLDTYGGNSGSAVINEKTLEVEGILVRGERDFVVDSERDCYVSNVCENDGCRGEDVTYISYIQKAIEEATVQQ